MATEAQRLMMMSLGKIQGCRQQKGGINLYKSLLVTKVLFRARSVVYTENAARQQEEELEKEPVVENVVPEEVEPVEEQPQHDSADQEVPDISPDHIEDNQNDFDDFSQDKENLKPMDNKPQNHPVSEPEDFSDCEESQKCSRRNKRRLTEVEQAVESISPKKQRLEEDDAQEYEEQPMQVEQISSLVNRFSSGFTGLLASESVDNGSDSDNEDNDATEEGQGHSSDSSSLLSCSNQIKESFELLARPIALSV